MQVSYSSRFKLSLADSVSSFPKFSPVAAVMQLGFTTPKAVCNLRNISHAHFHFKLALCPDLTCISMELLLILIIPFAIYPMYPIVWMTEFQT